MTLCVYSIASRSANAALVFISKLHMYADSKVSMTQSSINSLQFLLIFYIFRIQKLSLARCSNNFGKLLAVKRRPESVECSKIILISNIYFNGYFLDQHIKSKNNSKFVGFNT